MMVFAVSVLVTVLGDMRTDINKTMLDVALIKQQVGIANISSVESRSHKEG